MYPLQSSRVAIWSTNLIMSPLWHIDWPISYCVILIMSNLSVNMNKLFRLEIHFRNEYIFTWIATMLELFWLCKTKFFAMVTKIKHDVSFHHNGSVARSRQTFAGGVLSRLPGKSITGTPPSRTVQTLIRTKHFWNQYQPDAHYIIPIMKIFKTSKSWVRKASKQDKWLGLAVIRCDESW